MSSNWSVSIHRFPSSFGREASLGYYGRVVRYGTLDVRANAAVAMNVQAIKQLENSLIILHTTIRCSAIKAARGGIIFSLATLLFLQC